MLKKTIQSLLIIAGCVLASVVIKSFLFHPGYGIYDAWATHFNLKEYRFSFCKYNLSDEYSLLGYHSSAGFEYEKELLVYGSVATNQRLILLKLREHPKVALEKVRVIQGLVKKTVNNAITPMNKEGIGIGFLFPMFMTQKMHEQDDGLILKGEELSEPEYFETEKTQVLYTRGKFTKLGFYKPSGSIFRRYPIPVIDFRGMQQGAVAVIKSKQTRKEIIVYNVDGIIPSSKLSKYEQKILKSLTNETGETIFAIGYTEKEKGFDEEEFKQIVRSVTFDAMFPGGKMLELAAPKSSQFTHTTATHQLGPFKWKTEKKTIGQ